MNDFQICGISNKICKKSIDCDNEEDNKNLCDHCHEKKFRYKCAVCKKAKYCSKVCQINDWKDNHKHKCKKVNNHKRKCKKANNHKSKLERSLGKIYKSQCFCDCGEIKCYLHEFKPCYYCKKNKKKSDDGKDEFTYCKLSIIGWVHKSCYAKHMENQCTCKFIGSNRFTCPIHRSFQKPCPACGKIVIRPEDYHPSCASRYEINESWEYPVCNGFHKQCVKSQNQYSYTNKWMSKADQEYLDRWSFSDAARPYDWYSPAPIRLVRSNKLGNYL